MGIWKHRKRESVYIRGLCVVCETNPQKKVASTNKYRPICSSCSKRLYEPNRHKLVDKVKRPYRKFVGSVCESCGFVPEDICQLDVDHIDGNKNNNNLSNLQTLCANCHRLKTRKNEDWKISN